MHTLNSAKPFLKTAAGIALPVSIQALVQSSLSMADQLMIGQFGETAIAAVGLGGTLSFILMIALSGVIAGGSIYLAQFWGVKDLEGMKKTTALMLQLGCAAAVFLSAGTALFPQKAVGLFTEDGLVIQIGASYLRILSVSFVPMFLILMSATLLRNTGHVRIPLYTGVLAVLLNTGLNYLLIFGKLGMPMMGVEGAAVATAVTRWVEMTLLAGLCLRLKVPGLPRVSQIGRLDASFAKGFLATAAPVMLGELFWVLGDAMYSVIYGHMGTSEMAAMTMTFPVQGLFIGLFTGLSAAAGMMIGNQLGAGEMANARLYARRFIKLTLSGALAAGAGIWLISGIYLSAYKVTGEVRQLSAQLLTVFAAVIWLKVTNMVIGNGILRSGGETKYTFFMDMFGLWGIGVPLGFFAAFLLNWPIAGVYLLIAVEEAVRLGLGLHRVRSGKWIRKLTGDLSF